MIEKMCGHSSNFRIDMAATISEDTNIEQNNMMSSTRGLNGTSWSTCYVSALYLSVVPMSAYSNSK